MILEKDFEDILCKYPELIEPGLIFKGRQIHIYGRRMDILFEDKFNRNLIVELKVGPIKDEHIGQILSYEGILLSSENPTIRVMLIGNRVPPNIRTSLDHHGIAWKEIPISYLKDYLSNKIDFELLKLFEQQIQSEYNKQNIENEWQSDLVRNIKFNKKDHFAEESKHQLAWQKQFQGLIEYRKKHPESWPKSLEEFPIGNKLGLWCLNQRTLFKHGKLSQERIDKLLEISFVFVTQPHQDAWEKQFQHLVEYRNKHPESWPKQLEEFPVGNKLGLWCLTQRNAFKQGRLSQERINKLSEISFVFVAFPHQDAWEEQFNNLTQFRKEYPDRWPLSNEEYPQGNNLGAWISRQRHLYNKEKMLPENFEKLNQIGFDFVSIGLPTYNKIESYREQSFQQLESFFKEHVQICVEDGVFIEKGELYKEYKGWARKNGHYPQNLARFSQYVYLKYSSVTPKQARIIYEDNTKKRIWRNIYYVGDSTVIRDDVADLEQFIQNECVVEKGGFISSADFREKFLQVMGYHKGYKTISKFMDAHGYKIGDGRPLINGKQTRGYSKLRWKTDLEKGE